MSLRPEESIRKAIAAGYGNRPNSPLSQPPDDDTVTVAKVNVDFAMGDWLCIDGATLEAGHLKGKKSATAADSKAWIGVAMHSGISGTFAKIKTCGIAIAKVQSGASFTKGDTLQVKVGQVYAELGGSRPCGRYLMPFTDTNLAWVSINGSGEARILIHHHVDDDNTAWIDTTTGSEQTARSWNLFRVRPTKFTGPVFDYRLMLAIGGSATHGTNNHEGYAWGGVIGDTASEGHGQIGGETGVRQGIFGAELVMADDDNNRINVRSCGGWSVWDRFAFLAYPMGIGPHRYGWPPQTPSWDAPDACDIEGTGCPSGLCWWSGEHIFNTGQPPINGATTGWIGQFAPAVPCERDCKAFTCSPGTPGDWDCNVIDNPSQLLLNACDLKGAYEMVIPYGYVPKAGRDDVLTAITGRIIPHIEALWRVIEIVGAAFDAAVKCLDDRMTAFGIPDPCCPQPGAAIPVIDIGNHNVCGANSC